MIAKPSQSAPLPPVEEARRMLANAKRYGNALAFRGIDPDIARAACEALVAQTVREPAPLHAINDAGEKAGNQSVASALTGSGAPVAASPPQAAQQPEPNATPAGGRGGSQEWCDKPGETGNADQPAGKLPDDVSGFWPHQNQPAGEPDALISEAIEALRKWAISQHVGKCYLCETSWSEGAPDAHTANCLISRLRAAPAAPPNREISPTERRAFRAGLRAAAPSPAGEPTTVEPWIPWNHVMPRHE